MKASTEIRNYTDYRNLTPMQRLEIYKAVKNQYGVVKSVTKLDRLCFEYFVKSN